MDKPKSFTEFVNERVQRRDLYYFEITDKWGRLKYSSERYGGNLSRAETQKEAVDFLKDAGWSQEDYNINIDSFREFIRQCQIYYQEKIDTKQKCVVVVKDIHKDQIKHIYFQDRQGAKYDVAIATAHRVSNEIDGDKHYLKVYQYSRNERFYS